MVLHHLHPTSSEAKDLGEDWGVDQPSELQFGNWLTSWGILRFLS